MTARQGIVTGGTWCCDHNKLVEHWPCEDGLAEILSEERDNGGSASNMAVDLKRLDPDFFVETIGVVGDDEDGRMLVAKAASLGIDHTRLRIVAGIRTNYTDCFTSRASGRRTHIYLRGTNTVLTPDEFDFNRTRAALLHLGLPGVHGIMDSPWGGEANGWVAVLKKARAAGLRTNMELASVAAETIRDIIRPCLPHLDLLVINDVEVGAIAGMATSPAGKTDIVATLEAAKRVMAAGSMELLVVHFPRGAIALTLSGDVVTKPSVRVPQEVIVGANGAGDAFAAGMLYGFESGWPLDEAIALAHATAAASLRSLTTTGGVLPWKDCLALADKWGWRDAEIGVIQRRSATKIS